MACDLKILNGYGDGSLGDVTNPAGQINSYANVMAYTANSITIGTPSNGIYETFAVGKEIVNQRCFSWEWGQVPTRLI